MQRNNIISEEKSHTDNIDVHQAKDRTLQQKRGLFDINRVSNWIHNHDHTKPLTYIANNDKTCVFDLTTEIECCRQNLQHANTVVKRAPLHLSRTCKDINCTQCERKSTNNNKCC